MNKGKVPRHEWPAIVRRHEAGESFTVISRDYGCSAPAIRYIVNRFDHLPSGQVASAIKGAADEDVATADPIGARPDPDDEGLALTRPSGEGGTLDFTAATAENEALMVAQRA